MQRAIDQLRKHSSEAYLVAFLLMVVPPIPLYYAARGGAIGWIWGLLALIVLGNLLVLFIR